MGHIRKGVSRNAIDAKGSNRIAIQPIRRDGKLRMKKVGLEILITACGIVLVTSFVSASIDTFSDNFPMCFAGCSGEDKSDRRFVAMSISIDSTMAIALSWSVL